MTRFRVRIKRTDDPESREFSDIDPATLVVQVSTWLDQPSPADTVEWIAITREGDTNIMAMDLGDDPARALTDAAETAVEQLETSAFPASSELRETSQLRAVLEWMEKPEGMAKLRFTEALNLLRGIISKRSHGPFPLPDDVQQVRQDLTDLGRELRKDLYNLARELADYPNAEDIEQRFEHLESEDSRIETTVDELETRVTDLENPT